MKQRLYFVRFEDLVAQPASACRICTHGWDWRRSRSIREQLTMGMQESDSHYRMKYPHRQSTRIATPTPHAVPPRIQKQIETVWAWFYRLYYPPPQQR